MGREGMKALILNSGRGSRMGDITQLHPKCMTEIAPGETILSRQLGLLADFGIQEAVITTGPFEESLISYVQSLNLPIHCEFVRNDRYMETNYIFSIYLARHLLDSDIILMHGDLVYDAAVLSKLLAFTGSCMTVSSTLPLPEKDFKAVLSGNFISAVGIEFFGENAVAAQPLYLLRKESWRIWLDEIISFCENGTNTCYAENALNQVSGKMELAPLDVKDLLCAEIDTEGDLQIMKERLEKERSKTVYMCFSTDLIHSGHIAIIKKASKLGKLVIGVLSDKAVASYKRFPLLPFEERKALLENISGVSSVITQETLSYLDNIASLHPDYLVHGDDWQEGIQKPIRKEAIEALSAYGGQLVEYPYANNERYRAMEERARMELSLPDLRRSRLRKLLGIKQTVSIMEAHSGITGRIVEETRVFSKGETHQFDGMWISSLCDSTAKGKPDIELVDLTSRLRTIDDIMEVTTKPIIFDGDTGGLTEHFVYTVNTLERMGVSMVIIEDKTGLKKNSLFGTDVQQVQDSIENFCAKIAAGKRAQKSRDFMICARVESLILEQGMEDALARSFAYVEAGVDAIMIHSRKETPDEIFEFLDRFRSVNSHTPIVLVPTSYNMVTEEEFGARGANIIIYANQLTRSGVPAMQRAAKLILENHRAKECDEICMSIKEILRLIPENDI